MIRWGLCCKFTAAPIFFRSATARYMAGLSRRERWSRYSSLALENASALRAAMEYCVGHGIGCFRVNSRILPLCTHPGVGYRVVDLPQAPRIVAAFRDCGRWARANDLRLTFHPDQFILLSSPHRAVTRASIAELEYQAQVAEWIGADVINIHAGGAYGDKPAALSRLAGSLNGLSRGVRRRLTIENDERNYTPRELLPFCAANRIPMVYDVHHHRCLPDGLSIPEATAAACATWDREPLLHISSPRQGRRGPHPERHRDYIRLRDFPREWLDLDVTVEVEAKAKELAIAQLVRRLRRTYHVSNCT